MEAAQKREPHPWVRPGGLRAKYANQNLLRYHRHNRRGVNNYLASIESAIRSQRPIGAMSHRAGLTARIFGKVHLDTCIVFDTLGAVGAGKPASLEKTIQS